MPQPLPEFDQPPLTEVVFSVQFQPLPRLQAPHQGLVWQLFRDRFPRTEQHAPLGSSLEQFGPASKSVPRMELQFSQNIPTPRVWFLNEDGSELIQVQNDRFVRNWRKLKTDATYPRFSKLRKDFRQDFAAFIQHLDNEELGKPEPNQCELTYVNHLPAGEGWGAFGELGNVVTVFGSNYSDDYLSEPESIELNIRYLIKDENQDSLGRLHVSLTPVFREDGQAGWRLSLTARGRPEGQGLDGVSQFMDRAHESIVRGFASITTQRMHEIWRRKR